MCICLVRSFLLYDIYIYIYICSYMYVDYIHTYVNKLCSFLMKLYLLSDTLIFMTFYNFS